ncbi:C39 family peptidase [Collinsella sp. An7]|uniref:C39 family peptidase n=1 Tax=Collinsella sp. An7 TaxID=1965651 RepID=UPI0013022B5A|nr:C39 family peptidase [Collinsella sp. An7]
MPVAPSGDSEEEGGESAQGSTGENGVTGVQPGDDGDGSQDVANPEADSDSDPSAPEPDNGEGDSGQYPPDQDSGIGESGGSALDGFTDAAGQLTSDAGLDESADEGSVEEETEGAGIESESLESAPTEASTLTPELSYAAHVSNIGWQNPVANGVQAGTTGRALAVEALRFTLKGAPVSDLVIRAHISDLGWQQEVSSDKVVGTTGQAKSIEALNIKLKGELGAQYDVWYRVHVANFGWLGWTSNGQNAGSVGYGNAVEAVQIKLVKKGEGIDGSTSTPFKDRADEPPSVVYRAHVRNIGWKENVSNGATAGTTGRALPVEAVSASISWYGHSGTVSVRAHVQDIGWQNWSTGTGGTTGRAKHIEAIQLRLSGEVANDWDIWYRVHAANIGWMGWTCNGAAAGTTGKNYAVEAVQIKLVKKGGSAPGPTANSYAGVSESLASVAYGVTGSSVSVSGSNPLSIGSTTGGNALQSFSLVVNNQIRTGTVEYRVRRQFGSWEGSWHANGAQTSSSRDGQQIEGVQIKLSGELSTAYDVWYRVNTASWGWSGWGCNGTSVGSEGSASGVRGLQVQLVKKGSGAPGSISNAYRKNSGSPALVYQAHSRDIGWQALVPSGKTAGTTGKAKSIEALRVGFSGSVSGSVEVSAHVSNIGWQGFVGTGALAGTTGRALSVEAVKIKLSGAVASQYDVVYRVHSSEYGWLGWARNGSVAGTTGLNRPIEAIEVKLVAKGASTPSSSVPAYIPAPAVSYQSYLSSGGWQKAVSNGVLSGTTGQARAITGVRVTYGSASQVPGDVSYSVHVQDIGWMSDVYSGKDAGSQAKDKQIEAIKIKLTGQAATYYDIWYRAYVENYGWLGWTKNGGQAGTGTIGYRMEAFQVVIKAKGSAAPGSTANAYRDKPYSVNAALLNVPCLMQYPELPTGCESVALTNVLNYYGYGLAKSTIADSYLPRSSSNFVTAFWGNPHSSSGNCTSAPGIVNAANSFLSQHGGARHAYDVSGVSLEGMYSHLQNGNPVIVWSTIRQANIGAVYARQWYNGKQYFTVTNSHTVVLRGFDRARNVVYLSDSISGYVTMDASRFYLLYSLRGSQAVVVR